MENNGLVPPTTKKSIWKWLKWIVIPIILFIIGFLVVLFGYMRMSFTPVDTDNPPQFIQADFVELDKVYSISKFRSGVGHDFSGSGETCRSMKHYFATVDVNQPNYKMYKDMEMKDWPHPVEGVDATIFSPVDGYILGVTHQKEKGWAGDEIKVLPSAQSNVVIRLMHVTPINDDIKLGTKVTAGQKIGLVLANQSFDIAISSMSPFRENYISYFAAMSDEVFAKYQARGATSRDDFILTKEEVDAHPWQCIEGTEQFAESYTDDLEGLAYNTVFLSGYDEVQEIVQEQWQESGKN